LQTAPQNGEALAYAIVRNDRRDKRGMVARNLRATLGHCKLRHNIKRRSLARPFAMTTERKQARNGIKKGMVKTMKFINIGSGNMVAAARVVALASPDSAPIKRLVSEAKEEGRVIDVSCGRRTRTVIFTDSEHLILSAIKAETISNRILDSDSIDEEEAEEEAE
jgi:regulator of extracellular matrix RemA (YlzA/DUF370 family)